MYKYLSTQYVKDFLSFPYFLSSMLFYGIDRRTFSLSKSLEADQKWRNLYQLPVYVLEILINFASQQPFYNANK